MTKVITANTARAVGKLVSALFPQQIVFTLNLLFDLTSTCAFLYRKYIILGEHLKVLLSVWCVDSMEARMITQFLTKLCIEIKEK